MTVCRPRVYRRRERIGGNSTEGDPQCEGSHLATPRRGGRCRGRGPAVALATYPGKVGQIAFGMKAADGNTDVYSILPDGSAQRDSRPPPRSTPAPPTRRTGADRFLQRPQRRIRDLADGRGRLRPAQAHPEPLRRALPSLFARRPSDRLRGRRPRTARDRHLRRQREWRQADAVHRCSRQRRLTCLFP